MRHVRDLMEELGFRKDSSTDVQKAFIKYLIAAANQDEGIKTPSTLTLRSVHLSAGPSKPLPFDQSKNAADQIGDQLSFDFDEAKKTG